MTAALESFAGRGYHGTTLKDISQGSGLSTAALYVHFDSKAELLYEISRRGHEAVLGVLRAGAALDVGPDERMRVLVYSFTRWHAENRTLATVVHHERSALREDHGREVREMQAEITGIFRDAIKAGIDSGYFDVDDLRGAAAVLLSLAIDVARWYNDDAPYTPDALGQLYCLMAGRPLGARPAG
jgi:AcrR family transcriptional regulator